MLRVSDAVIDPRVIAHEMLRTAVEPGRKSEVAVSGPCPGTRAATVRAPPSPRGSPATNSGRRVVYEIDQTEATVTIIAIQHRADVYRPR